MPETVHDLQNRKTVLLFYKEFEADKFIKYDRYLKRILRPLYELTHHRQKKTGFAVSFALMKKGLEQAGYDVRVNDYRTARRHPDYPVGLVGFPTLLDGWDLPNPALLGPSMFDHPKLVPGLFENPSFRKYVTLAPWAYDIFAEVYGNRCFQWFAGIDLEEWPDLSAYPKTYDFIVYDKIRWDHDAMDQSLLQPVLRELEKRALTYRLVRYKHYDHAVYRCMLKEARGLLFICEHETQGIAYQEAMASNVPVLAWDAGVWADPLWKRFGPQPKASSVPFFSPACGEKFLDIAAFSEALDRFLQKRSSYRPRTYVEQDLSMQKSAKIYADQYFGIAP